MERIERLKRRALSLSIAASALAVTPAWASTAYGDLNNFDCVNDTGQETHGFEIEIDDVRSTDITYTFDWNHYGAPVVREDLSDPAHPRVFVRYAAQAKPDGTWSAYTAVPSTPLAPTDGHSCTDPSVNQGCEHFGVGYFGTPTAIKYHWLIADPARAGQLALGPAVAVSTPSWTYSPPVLVDPALPPEPANVVQPAQVVAAIPAPELPVPAGKQFGEPVWMKSIKTTTHNANPVALGDLVSDDVDQDGEAEWRNNEPDEVEFEWVLVQNRADGNDEVAALAPDEMGGGDEVVTRRYEFYAYRDPNPIGSGSIDGETAEAMCDQVAADDLHGVGMVSVTDPNGGSYEFDCGATEIVGPYIGAQMAAFAAAPPLGMVEHIQDGEAGMPYTPRVVVVGGNTPYQITALGLPAGMSIGPFTDAQTGEVRDGVLHGTPTTAGDYDVQLQAQDADGATTSISYGLHVAGVVPVQHLVTVNKVGGGAGTVNGGGIDCGATCSTKIDAGSALTLTAVPATGSVFAGWGGACSGLGSCQIVGADADVAVSASFVVATTKYPLSVGRTGSGTVTSSPRGISCGSKCSASFAVASNVKLTATPAKKKVFLGWTGACSGQALTCIVPMYGPQSVGASFSP